jgi:hypothetical protein
MTHWTGHASRLDRPGITEPTRFGSDHYSREEPGLASLCEITGTDPPVPGWLRQIRDGPARPLPYFQGATALPRLAGIRAF